MSATGVTTDLASGTLVLEELSLDAITRILSEKKTGKGEYSTVIEDFVSSNTLYLDFMSLPTFAGKDQAAIVQSVNGNLKKIYKANEAFPKCTVAKVGERTLLINMEVHAAQLATAAK